MTKFVAGLAATAVVCAAAYAPIGAAAENQRRQGRYAEGHGGRPGAGEGLCAIPRDVVVSAAQDGQELHEAASCEALTIRSR